MILLPEVLNPIKEVQDPESCVAVLGDLNSSDHDKILEAHKYLLRLSSRIREYRGRKGLNQPE